MFGFDYSQLKWSESHGVTGAHLGAGMLYFGLPYMLRAKRCVCLGSGAGFVPMMMVAAQQQLVSEGLLERADVTLVDADVGIWGRPVYQHGTDISPHVRLVKQFTRDAMGEVGGGVQFLHVDADHSFDGVMEDLVNYLPLMSGEWAITVHDTHNVENQHLPIGSWDAAKQFAEQNDLVVTNFHVGCGTALIRPVNG